MAPGNVPALVQPLLPAIIDSHVERVDVDPAAYRPIAPAVARQLVAGFDIAPGELDWTALDAEGAKVALDVVRQRTCGRGGHDRLRFPAFLVGDIPHSGRP